LEFFFLYSKKNHFFLVTSTMAAAVLVSPTTSGHKRTLEEAEQPAPEMIRLCDEPDEDSIFNSDMEDHGKDIDGDEDGASKPKEGPALSLAQLNPHPRDALISFQEEGHLYTIQGVEGHPISVTTLIHSMFQEFDADLIIDKMMKSPNWRPGYRYFGMTKEQIKLQWDQNRDQAAQAGTLMHKTIEDFLNLPEQTREEARLHFCEHKQVPLPHSQTPEFMRFMAFWNALAQKRHYRPYRTEWLVFDADKRLAGSIDLILEDKRTGELLIVDWKRSKEIKMENRWQSGKHCLSHLPDCNYIHYSLQLNIYRHLLETLYGKKVKLMYLVVLHPAMPAFRVPIKRMEDEIVQLMQRLPLTAAETEALAAAKTAAH